MAQRRMFSPDIVESDAFLDMPISTQGLYFHLGMFADDDGFINPKKIMRMIGVAEDDFKILIAKRFVISFPDGVVVIKHWKINNLVRKDWYRPTQYLEHKDLLVVKENGAYTELGNEPLTNRQRRLGKVRLGKDSKKVPSDLFDLFWEEYPPTRKQDKRKCFEKWEKLTTEVSGEMILADVKDRKARHHDWVKDNAKFVPAPLVYLNNARWEAPIVEDSKSKPAIVFGGK